MRRIVQATAVLALALVLVGCEKDRRNTDEKLATPPLQYTNRPVMGCPKCNAPTRPYSISATQSYYSCSGLPPKFERHPEVKWSNAVEKDNER